MPPYDEAEIRDGDGWRRIDIAEALGSPRNSEMRCPECHGRVRLARAGFMGQPARFCHRQSHNGCSLKAGSFDGRRSKHPAAIK